MPALPRAYGLGAVVFAVASTVAFGIVQPIPTADAPLADVVAHHTARAGAFAANALLNDVGYVGLVVAALALGVAYGGLRGAAVGAFGLLGAGTILVFQAFAMAVVRLAPEGPEAVRTAWAVVNLGFPGTGLPLAAMLAAVALAERASPVLPRWAGPAAWGVAGAMTVLAASAAVPALFPVGVAGFPLLSLWLLPTGVASLRHPSGWPARS